MLWPTLLKILNLISFKVTFCISIRKVNIEIWGIIYISLHTSIRLKVCIMHVGREVTFCSVIDFSTEILCIFVLSDSIVSCKVFNISEKTEVKKNNPCLLFFQILKKNWTSKTKEQKSSLALWQVSYSKGKMHFCFSVIVLHVNGEGFCPWACILPKWHNS